MSKKHEKISFVKDENENIWNTLAQNPMNFGRIEIHSFIKKEQK